MLQALRMTRLNFDPYDGYDNAESVFTASGGQPRAGETYGVAGQEVPRSMEGWYPSTGARLNS